MGKRIETREKPSERKIKYDKYILSKEWGDKKLQIFEKRGKVCEMCNSTKDIQVHHLTYKRLFNELDTDLQVVCKSCHKRIHYLEKIGKKMKPLKKGISEQELETTLLWKRVFSLVHKIQHCMDAPFCSDNIMYHPTFGWVKGKY